VQDPPLQALLYVLHVLGAREVNYGYTGSAPWDKLIDLSKYRVSGIKVRVVGYVSLKDELL
jgi:hypothetical protein